MLNSAASSTITSRSTTRAAVAMVVVVLAFQVLLCNVVSTVAASRSTLLLPHASDVVAGLQMTVEELATATSALPSEQALELPTSYRQAVLTSHACLKSLPLEVRHGESSDSSTPSTLLGVEHSSSLDERLRLVRLKLARYEESRKLHFAEADDDHATKSRLRSGQSSVTSSEGFDDIDPSPGTSGQAIPFSARLTAISNTKSELMPAVAMSNTGNLFYTADDDIAFSADQGSTWTRIDPYSIYLLFLGRQQVLYDMPRNIFVHLFQGLDSNAGTSALIIQSRNASNPSEAFGGFLVTANALNSYNWPANCFLFSNNAALSSLHVLVSLSVARSDTLATVDEVILRIPLDDLSKATISTGNIAASSLGTIGLPFALAASPERSVVAAIGLTGLTQARAIQFNADGSFLPREVIFTGFTASAVGSVSCPSVTNVNWCSHTVSYFTTGAISGDFVWFASTQKSTVDRTNTWVYLNRYPISASGIDFDSPGPGYAISSATYRYAHPTIVGSSAGHLGLVLAGSDTGTTGGYANFLAGVWDASSSTFDVKIIASGSANPAEGRWTSSGVQPVFSSGLNQYSAFVGSGYIIDGNGCSSTSGACAAVNPYVAVFGIAAKTQGTLTIPVRSTCSLRLSSLEYGGLFTPVALTAGAITLTLIPGRYRVDLIRGAAGAACSISAAASTSGAITVSVTADTGIVSASFGASTWNPVILDPVATCSVYSTCATCGTNSACGWCTASRSCLSISVGTCPAGQWRYQGANCCGDGVKDADEECEPRSTGCCSDTCSLLSAGTVCNAATNLCEQSGMCSGTSAACPARSLKPNGTVCRSLIADCDIEEYCTGSSASCPPNAVKPQGALCRFAPCLQQTQCDGVTGICLPGQPEPSTFLCRPAVDACDRPEYCNGFNNCPADVLQPQGSVCRTASGPCDLPTTCSGQNASCPSTAYRSATTVCRSASSVCDAEERCTGQAATCPTDLVAPSSVICRSASGPCDAVEFCSAQSTICPPNRVQPNTSACSPGVCAFDSRCDGRTISCPIIGYRGSNVMCHQSIDFECDNNVTCSGVNASCPDLRPIADGTACRLGKCSNGVCSASTSSGGASWAVTGGIAGAAAGGTLIIAGLAFFFWRKHQRQRKPAIARSHSSDQQLTGWIGPSHSGVMTSVRAQPVNVVRTASLSDAQRVYSLPQLNRYPSGSAHTPRSPRR